MVLPFIAFYYAAFAREARTASRAYLQRLRQRPVRFTEVVVHVLRFCQCALDRMYFMQGRTELFEIERTGQAHLQRVREQGRGAILLGAHLGSFEALRAMSREEQVPVNVLVHFENARKINSVLSAIAPEGMTGIIAIDPADPSFVFAVQERIEAGELVAILGDRVGLGERSVEVPFMGDLARFPVGAFLLASALGCPVYLTFGLYTAPNRYRLFCEPFSDRVELPRRDRDRRLQDLATRFAARLEHYCRLAPDNWFNFFAFWSRR
jgi:predicted LPLAT superfamily acyltransferase